MKMTTYNDIGIKNELDWKRIRKLMILGLLGAVMTFIGDFILGFRTGDESLTGLEQKLSSYLSMSDTEIFISAFLGFIGIPLEGLCYFGIYRLIAPYSMKWAHIYRSGVLGYLIFAACGVHVPCLACVYFYKYSAAVSPATAFDDTIRFGMYFLLPGMIAFLIFFIVQSAAHICAFAKGLTPYPKWCWIFCMPVGMAAAMLLKFAGNNALASAITAAWISIGNLWMFGGSLIMMNKAEKEVG
ncbi:MAG: hypothetical protein IJT87_05425 [Ruminiclostridium sp.]|nr:hypothetical protein [Ruminiclostridium sp.]